MSSTYFPSAGGDDRSISGSSDTSDTSQSDCSIGSRLAIWTEPASSPPESVSHVAAKVSLQSMEKLPASQGAGNRPAVKPPRQLQEIGRQSSSDSGIATGSHSSYSGSFSSYTGSLDITPGEDFGSVFSLPPHLAQDLSPCTCSTAPGHEYQVPTSLRYLYDSPRSLLHEGNEGTKHNEPSSPAEDLGGLITETGKGDQSTAMTSEGLSVPTERQFVCGQLHRPLEETQNTKMVPSTDHPDSCLICSSLTPGSKTIVTICAACGGYKVSLMDVLCNCHAAAVWVWAGLIVVVSSVLWLPVTVTFSYRAGWCHPVFGVKTTSRPTVHLSNMHISSQLRSTLSLFGADLDIEWHDGFSVVTLLPCVHCWT